MRVQRSPLGQAIDAIERLPEGPAVFDPEHLLDGLTADDLAGLVANFERRSELTPRQALVLQHARMHLAASPRKDIT